MTAPIVNHETGEITATTPTELAAAWRDAHANARRLASEARDIATLADTAKTEAEILEQLLLNHMDVGTSIPLPDGTTVACVTGRRRNATVNRDAAEQVAEMVEDLGLVEHIQPPVPPPTIKVASPSKWRAFEAVLAARGIAVGDIVRDGGPGEPVLEVVTR